MNMKIKEKVGDVIMKEYIHLWDTVSKLVKKFDVGKPTPLRTTKVHFIEKTLSPIKGEATKDFNIAVNMMKRIHSLLEKHSELLQEADQKLIARCLTYLGFYELADSLCPTQVLITMPACFEILLLAPHRQNWVKRIRYVIFDEIEKYGFPSDLALSPRESIQLYDTMCQVWKSWPQAQNLCPENFTQFKNKIVIKMLDARKYEESLKEEFTNWVKNGNEKEARLVLKNLSPDYHDYSGQMLDFFPCLVEKLRKMEKLPAVFFLFSLDTVEECAESVCEFLEEKQEEKRPPKADKVAYTMTNKLRKVKKSLEKQKIDEKGQKSSRRLDQSIMYEAEHDYLLKSLEKNLEIPKDCTYADQKAIDEEALQMVFKRVKYERKGDTLKKLARRGIGYHHSSMTNKEKQLVEILFRKGFIRVVTATRTLSLGINMPCKSVVFAQNSVYLDALNYRQMSGRAGRRGQDLLGDVYFFDIPLPKIGKLIKSKVPDLRGQFPLSITLILRLMLLATKADDLEDGKAKALSVLKHSLLSFKQPRATDMLKLYFLYSLQFLVKEGHIDQEGNPTGFAGLVTHLHYHEPSNLVFVSFLVKGLFHKLCQPTSKDSKCFSEDVMEKLVLVLANLFGRRYIPAKFHEAHPKFYQSKVFLDDLPQDFSDALLEYNMQVTRDFASFLLIVSRLADMKQEYQLPLSKIG
ncbi:rCG41175, partial [Rattus norvegicus]